MRVLKVQLFTSLCHRYNTANIKIRTLVDEQFIIKLTTQMNAKQNYTNEIICECGNKYKTQGHYNRHLQCSKHVRYLQFAEQPLREYSELKGDLRYSFDKLRSPTNVNAIIEKYNTIDIYTQQPVTFENNGRLQKQYEIEHIHEIQVLVYAIKRATPSLLGRALGPLCEIINDIPNLGICHKSVNILKGGAVKYFLDHLEKPKKISFYDALTRYSTGAIRPNAQYAKNIIHWINNTHESFSNSIREA